MTLATQGSESNAFTSDLNETTFDTTLLAARYSLFEIASTETFSDMLVRQMASKKEKKLDNVANGGNCSR